MNYFEYNGTSSLDMGLRIESKNVFSAPEYEVDFLTIPGRDGDLIARPGRYPNVQVTYSVFLPAKSTQELAEKILAVKEWLYEEPDRYHELTDTYDTEFFREAVYAGKLDIADELNRIGVFTISFSCLPFRYSTAGSRFQSITSSGTAVTNPFITPSKPYMKIYGSGDISLTIQSVSKNATWHFTDIDSYIEVDSNLMNFYRGTEPQNDKVVGDGFPQLYQGRNTISFTGAVSRIDIMPRWVTL